MRRCLSLLLLGCLVWLLLGSGPARAEPAQSGPRVEVFEASGVIDTSMLGALRRPPPGADRPGVAVSLTQLDSSGTLGVDPAELTCTVTAAEVPVAVWV